MPEAAPKNKWDWGFMAKKSTGGRAEIFLFYFIFLFFWQCTYVYIYWDARHVRPHIFCQFYSMQQHADSIIRVNGSRADGGGDPRSVLSSSNGNERESETTAKFKMHVYIVF